MTFVYCQQNDLFKQMKCILLFLAGLILTIDGFTQGRARRIISLNSDWQFSFVNNINKQSANNTVSIPHTWNANEVKNPKTNYQRTNAVYRKRVFLEKEWNNKRFFLLFEGANSVADVFVNKRYVGEHKGATLNFVLKSLLSFMLVRTMILTSW